jgi:hypothetical protein
MGMLEKLKSGAKKAGEFADKAGKFVDKYGNVNPNDLISDFDQRVTGKKSRRGTSTKKRTAQKKTQKKTTGKKKTSSKRKRGDGQNITIIINR